MKKLFVNETVPTLDLDLSQNPDCLTWEEKDNNSLCVTTYVDDPKGIIYGNFCNFVSNFPFKEPHKLETKSKELMYTGNSSGSFKKVYLGLKDSQNKEFIVTDEPLIRKNLEDDSEVNYVNPNNVYETEKKMVRDKLDFMKNEIVIQQKLHLQCPEIVPKIYSANIYIAKIKVNYKCDPIYEYRLQMLMEKVDTNGYIFLNKMHNDSIYLYNFIIYDTLYNSEDEYHVNMINFISHYKTLSSSGTGTEEIYNCFLFIMKYQEYIISWVKSNWFWLKPLFNSMKCIHDQGYIHNDIKGDNFAINNYEKNVKIIDFGMAKKISDQKELLKKTEKDYLEKIERNTKLDKQHKVQLKQTVKLLFKIPKGYENNPMMLEMYDVDYNGMFYSRFLQNSLFCCNMKHLFINYFIIPIQILNYGKNNRFGEQSGSIVYVDEDPEKDILNENYQKGYNFIYTQILENLEYYNNTIIPIIKHIQTILVNYYNKANRS